MKPHKTHEPGEIIPLYALRYPLTEVVVDEEEDHALIGLWFDGRYAGNIQIAKSQLSLVMCQFIANNSRSVGEIQDGEFTFDVEPETFNFLCVSGDGELYDTSRI